MPIRTTLCIVALALVLFIGAAPTWPQTRNEGEVATSPRASTSAPANPYSGKWTYRSYLNQPNIMVDNNPQTALNLIFGEGVMSFETPVGTALKGTLDLGGGFVLDLNGAILGEPSAAPPVVRISGIGRSSTPTDGWDYEYTGYLAWTWPNGIGQVPAIVGTVVRAKPHDHNQAKAGFVASFIATRQP